MNKLLFLSNGTAREFKYIEEHLYKLKEYYEIIPIGSHEKIASEILENLDPYSDIIIKDLTYTTFGEPANGKDIFFVAHDGLFPIGGLKTYIMTGNVHDFEELFRFISEKEL